MRDDQDLDDDDDEVEFEDPSWTPRQAAYELGRLFDCEFDDGAEIEFPPEPGFTVDEYISLGSREHLGEWDSLLIPMGFLTNVLWTLAKYGSGYFEDELIHPVVYQFSSIQWDKAPIEFYGPNEIGVYAPRTVFTRGHLVEKLSQVDLGDTQLFQALSDDFSVLEFAENFAVPRWVAYRAQRASQSVEESRVLWQQVRKLRYREARDLSRRRTEELEAQAANEWLYSTRRLEDEWSTAEAQDLARDKEIDRKMWERLLRERHSQELSKSEDEEHVRFLNDQALGDHEPHDS